MPKIFLSPSAQEFNRYVDGGTEEYYMNLVADAMEPYLKASGIDFDRNDRSKTLSVRITTEAFDKLNRLTSNKSEYIDHLIKEQPE